MTDKQLKDIVEAAGYETRSYSGRGFTFHLKLEAVSATERRRAA